MSHTTMTPLKRAVFVTYDLIRDVIHAKRRIEKVRSLQQSGVILCVLTDQDGRRLAP